MERNVFGQHDGVLAILPILKFAENDGSSPYKFVSAEDLHPILHDPAIDAALRVPETTLSVPLPAKHPANIIHDLLNEFAPSIDALVSEGARASTTGQWRRDAVLQVGKGLRAVSAVLDEGAPQPGVCSLARCASFLQLAHFGTCRHSSFRCWRPRFYSWTLEPI